MRIKFDAFAEAASVKDDGVNGQGDPVQASPRRPSRVPLTAAILRCGWKSLEVGNRKLLRAQL
jgi:hypothetical protein